MICSIYVLNTNTNVQTLRIRSISEWKSLGQNDTVGLPTLEVFPKASVASAYEVHKAFRVRVGRLSDKRIKKGPFYVNHSFKSDKIYFEYTVFNLWFEIIFHDDYKISSSI